MQTSKAVVGDAPLKDVLLIAPSAGMGGGIERYVRGVESALESQGVEYQRMDLRRADEGPLTFRSKIKFAFKVAAALRGRTGPTRIVVAHPALLPITLLTRFMPSHSGTIVVYYGSEVWKSGRIPGRNFARGSDVRAVAISTFTAGALQRSISATVVNPSLDAGWYECLLAAGEASTKSPRSGPPRILTVFRLQDWESKGLPAIVGAIDSLGTEMELVVVGSGAASPELNELVRAYSWLHLKTSLNDQELASEYAAADVVVLATRTTGGKSASGEGFGLCLVEGQLAGTAVIAPAFGGSHDTFLQGITGVSPVDETPEALAVALREMTTDTEKRNAMAQAGALWSRAAFEPGSASRRLVDVLLSPI